MNPEIIAQIPDTLTYQDGDRQVPYRDHPFFKEAPDLPTFLKTAVDTHKEFGSRLSLKVDKANVVELEKWRKDHLPRLYDAGVLERPPASPDDYNDIVKRPERLPEGWGWNDEFAKDFKVIAHRHGIPKAAIPELLSLHERTLTGAGKTLQTSVEAGMAALKAEYGDKYDERRAGAQRLTDFVFKTPEELAFFEELGIGNHPAFLSVLMRLAPLAQADSSFFVSQGTPSEQPGGLTHDQITAELADIATNKDNSRHAAYLRGDPQVQAYIDSRYRQVFGDKKIEIT